MLSYLINIFDGVGINIQNYRVSASVRKPITLFSFESLKIVTLTAPTVL